jgi:DNA-directed RNA polymerase specialized sigma24 family protein
VELPESNLSDDILKLHNLPEPGRSALTLCHMGLFPIDQIADIVGKHEKDLPELLVATRAALTATPKP